jgi:hypothetical protein
MEDIGIGNYFLSKTPNAQEIRELTNRTALSKTVPAVSRIKKHPWNGGSLQ